MVSTCRTIMLKAGRPTVAEARARLKAEMQKAVRDKTAVLKLIHGYGSGGVGGDLREAVRRSLRKRQKEGAVRCFVAGEKWDIFDESARQILDACPDLANDRDLNNYNEGVTIALLRIEP